MSLSADRPNWFALQVRTNRERQVSQMLRSKGYEEFLPIGRGRNDSRSHAAPLFPGYVFCRIGPKVHGLIVTTPGVIRIVGFGGKPASIDPEEVRSIQLLVSSGAATCATWGLQVGSKVRVEEGPLRGVIGTLTCVHKKTRLLVSINLMMRTVIAEVCPEWVQAITPLPAHNVSCAQPEPQLAAS
jgi:transcription antitermination factor NusG